MIKRVILVILDSLGVGELPDADHYGDKGSNTLGNMARVLGGLSLPNFEELGLGNIIPVKGVKEVKSRGAYGKMAAASAGKDTTSGHWEMMGIILKDPFPLYPDGFPLDLIQAFEELIGCQVLGNKAASGTEIIQELGKEHLKTGFPIIYTSADSVFQVAAHEEVIPVERLYQICRIARELLQGKHGVGRVIARPFTGGPDQFIRTERRHDFSLEPPRPMLLDYLQKEGQEVTAIGKVHDIFLGRGIARSFPTRDNFEGIQKIMEAIQSGSQGLVFANLVDFDMKYGHRNDPYGYARALQEVDKELPKMMASLKKSDVLMFSADHGCDPTTDSTDHSREYVPVLVAGELIKSGVDLGVRESFSDLGKTVADLLGVSAPDLPGKSFAEMIVK